MKLVPILVILVVLCGFLALEGQAKKVKKQNTKVRFGKISSGWQLLLGSKNQSKIRACVSLKSFWQNNVEISRDSSSIVRFLGLWRPSKKGQKAVHKGTFWQDFVRWLTVFYIFVLSTTFVKETHARIFVLIFLNVIIAQRYILTISTSYQVQPIQIGY